MNPTLLSSLLVSSLILLALADDPPMEVEEHPKMDCFPTSCGNVANITYPFWVEDKQPSHCGFPSFKISCENDVPTLQTQYQALQVKEIFYNNQSLLLVNEDFASRDCPSLQGNISFSLTPFNVSSVNRELVFLFNCSQPLPDYYEVPCHRTYAKLTHWGDDLGSLGTCRSELVPVVDYLGVDVKDYLRVVKNGFLVEWTAADCSECRGSKGQCGYREDTHNFMCICPDRAHWRMCERENHRGIIIGVGAGAGVGGAIIVGFCLALFFYKRRRKQRQASLSNHLARSIFSEISSKKDPEFGETNYNTHIFTYDELQEATNNFNESRELGDGGFGTVYKGQLRDGRTVAVKRLYENNYRRLEQFMNEVEILSPLRHPNLVTLYGCTSRHSRELLLVYEYISNGTLADHLHGTLASEKSLSWPIRMSIAIETADALAYLHAVEPQIIHRDVKSTNILLDNNFHVKVADFGLSRLFPLDATHVSTAPQGTPGYVDPEYYQCYQLTDKSDVYSFGVVLVELISSKPAVDISRHRHEINLANMAITMVQNCQIDQLVDSELGYMSDLEITRMINQVAELAFRCLQSDGEMRPGIREVLEVLKGIECVGKKAEKDQVEVTEVPAVEETRLLKNVMPFSPDTVTERWSSRSTTPNTSA